MSRAPAAGKVRTQSAPLAGGYFAVSEQPWISLVFILPFLIIYELGIRYYGDQPLVVFKHLQAFFYLFGATGRYLPAMMCVAILLSWHIARRDPWRIEPMNLLGMALESAVLAVPLIAMGLAVAHYWQYLPLIAGMELRHLLVMSIGAGIYEELVFRLVAFTVLNLILVDFFELKKVLAFPLIILTSAVVFSLYHYWGEPFAWQSFAFRTLAGVYFGVIFICRGFGITAGCHAAYDIIIVSLRA
jgi:hypothetical protein